MNRLIKLTTMASLLLLGLLLLASDSVYNDVFENENVVLTYEGDLLVSGKLALYDNDGDKITNISYNDLTLNITFYEITDNEETGDLLIFSERNYSFTLMDNRLEFTLKDQDINILNGIEKKNYRIEISLEFDDGNEDYRFYDTVLYTFIPKEI